MKLHSRLRAEGVVAARRGERLRAVAERDGAGWVVGYGHRASAREGAHVSEDDAVALLVYDLSSSAGRVEALLARSPPPAVFDAFNAYAWRVGPDAFARSDLLRRWNAGEALTSEQVLAARDIAPAQGGQVSGSPPSALLAAAEAVRDRVSQVLDAAPEPPPVRPAREPWREPPRTLVAQPEAPGTSTRDDAPSLAGLDGREGEHTGGGPHDHALDTNVEGATEAAPPPFLDPTAGSEALEASPVRAETRASEDPLPAHPDASLPPVLDFDLPASAPGPAAPAPMVSFERGGRARLGDRLRSDPRVYMAVGACGLVLFLCALAGSLLGRPSPLGIGLGLVGVLCLAPAVAFFLHRRAPPR